MRKDRSQRYVTGITTLLLAGMLSLSKLAWAESYLQELENEAAATGTGAKTGSEADKPAWSPKQTSLSEKIEPDLSQDQFEETLKSRFYGSYLFYSSLGEKKQQRVFEEYRQNNDIEHLREAIKRQMSN